MSVRGSKTARNEAEHFGNQIISGVDGTGGNDAPSVRQRQPRQQDKEHLKDVAALPCLVCASDAGCDPAHVRFSCEAEGKFNPGVGTKPDDCYVVPLCRRHHEEQHRMGEVAFWLKKGIRPLEIAKQLWDNRGDFTEQWAIVRELHRVHETLDELPF